MENNKNQGVEAGGFYFLNGEDAKLAEKERKQIDVIEKRIDYKNPEGVLAIYNKLIEERTFKTPIGTIYLKFLQNFLLNKTEIDRTRITAIPVYEPCERSFKEKETPIKKRAQEMKQKEKEKKADKLKFSIGVNILLIIAIIVMFWMTTKSDVPNIINYKKALENNYAAWDQELTEREAAIRIKEMELKIAE